MSRRSHNCHISGTLLEAHRTRQGYTQKALARKLGVDPYTVYRWESGRTQPSRLQILKIADTLCIRTYEIFENPEDLRQFITDSELAGIALEQLQRNTQMALRCFSPEELRRVQGFAPRRLQELLTGALPCPLEIQQLRSCLGAEFRPISPPATEPNATSAPLPRELLLAEQLQRLERTVKKLRRRLNRQIRRMAGNQDDSHGERRNDG